MIRLNDRSILEYSYRKLLFISVIVFLLFSSPLALGKNISEIITYDQWTNLVKHSAGKIPELQALWQWQKKTGHHVYVGGGALRGLLQWLHKNLQNHSLEEVKNMKVPGMTDLLIIKGSDIDLFAPDDIVEKIKHDLPQYANWDILSDSFHKINVKLGGPTIEKIRVNPNYWDDPLGGLRHYYEGKLVFSWTPEDEFRKLYWVKERGNTKTAEALRFLRMENDLPELKATTESYNLISQISEVEMPLIGIDRPSGVNWWIQHKGLEKLYKSTGKNFPETVDTLRKRNLLYLLGSKKFKIESGPQDEKTIDYVDNLIKRGFDINDLKLIERMQCSTISSSIKMMEKLLPMIKSPSDFIKATELVTTHPTGEYKTALENWIDKNIDVFFSTNPTLSDIKKLQQQSITSVEKAIKLKQKAIPMIKATKDFLELAEFNVLNPSDNYKTAMNNWIDKNIDVFFSTNPTLSDIKKLQQQSITSVETAIKLKQKAIPMIKATKDFLELAEFNVQNPNGNYKTATNNWIDKNIDVFFSTNPTLSDIKKLQQQSITSVETAIKLKQKAIPMIKATKDFLELAEFNVQNPNDNYKTAMNNWIDKNIDFFFSTNPTLMDITKLDRQYVRSIETRIKLKSTSINKFKKTADYLTLIKINHDNHGKEYKQAISKLTNETLDFFLSLNPNGSEIENFLNIIEQNASALSRESNYKIEKYSKKLGITPPSLRFKIRNCLRSFFTSIITIPPPKESIIFAAPFKLAYHTLVSYQKSS